MRMLNIIYRILGLITLSTFVSCSTNEFKGDFGQVILGKTLKVEFRIDHYDAVTREWKPFESVDIISSNTIEEPTIHYAAISKPTGLPSAPVKAIAWYEKSGELTLTWEKSGITYTYESDATVIYSLEFKPFPGDRLMKVSVVFEGKNAASTEIFSAVR
ncbi:MAG: hypothetical protein A2V93_12010 [Ignavibacteria bacterium RBG_16_34_14]|nr:MAG: hypothetical protein A2V93_12010 [Ignavibacteria bacterium RBG_16_34_14]